MLFLVQGSIGLDVWLGSARTANNRTMRLVDAVNVEDAKQKFKNFFEKKDPEKTFHYIVSNIEVLEMIK